MVIERFLRAGKSILFAGADVRLLRPARVFFESAPADAVFEARVDSSHGTIEHFTPDIFWFAPTPGALSFCAAVRDAIHVFSHQIVIEAVGSLLGPADQDILLDVLLTTIYQFPLAVRTRLLAKLSFGRMAYEEVFVANITQSRRVRPPDDVVPWFGPAARRKLSKQATHEMQLLMKRTFGRLNTTRLPRGGTLVTTKRLSAVFLDAPEVVAMGGPADRGSPVCQTVCSQTMRRRGRGQRSDHPAAGMQGSRYEHRTPAGAYAVHCRGKHPACVDLWRGCGCNAGASGRVARVRHGTGTGAGSLNLDT